MDLPRRGKVKQKYKKVKTKKDQARASAGESIEQRPPEVESREEFGLLGALSRWRRPWTI